MRLVDAVASVLVTPSTNKWSVIDRKGNLFAISNYRDGYRSIPEHHPPMQWMLSSFWSHRHCHFLHKKLITLVKEFKELLLCEGEAV